MDGRRGGREMGDQTSDQGEKFKRTPRRKGRGTSTCCARGGEGILTANIIQSGREGNTIMCAYIPEYVGEGGRGVA